MIMPLVDNVTESRAVSVSTDTCPLQTVANVIFMVIILTTPSTTKMETNVFVSSEIGKEICVASLTILISPVNSQRLIAFTYGYIKKKKM